MSKDIWHEKTERPEKLLHCTRLIITKWGSVYSEKDIDNGAFIETDWAYLDDLLALEIENKDLSDKIGKLKTELEKIHKALEIAKDTFNWIDETYRTGQETEAEIWGKVQLAAQKITALEQKDK